MRTIQIGKNPLCLQRDMYEKDAAEIKTGLTVLAGCNGSGKTTFLTILEQELTHNKIPCIKFDNLLHGGNNAKQAAAFRDDFAFVMQSAVSSEGENIILNMGQLAAKTGRFVKENPDIKELWILMDAVDSGLSIDNICDVKKYLFKPILNDSRLLGKEVYIVVSANTYEMAAEANCLDVQTFDYCKFSSYEEYKTFILKTKERKELRDK
jgi:energy-coupling factor transporter ATP-binding protein EcfA2